MDACVAIGIERTAGGENLPGAVNGAKQIAAWAEKCGYQTALVTDEGDTAVDIQRVRDALLTLLPSPRDGSQHGGPVNPPDRLIIYFAGHGLQNDMSPMWLLSNSQNTQEAIGMSQLQDLVASYGVPQVAIIADACRSPTVRDWNVRITPHQVLPLGPFNMLDQVVDVDLFQAVPQYQQAFMLRAKDGAPARCIFTSVLMEALHGANAAVFTATGQVTSDTIVRYLRKEVESRAGRYKVPMRPQVRASWLDTANVYIDRTRLETLKFPPLDPWPELAAPAAGQGPVAGMGPLDVSFAAKSMGFNAGSDVSSGWTDGDDQSFRGGDWLGETAEDAFAVAVAKETARLSDRKRAIDPRQDQLETAFKRTTRLTHFESGCGVTLTGSVFANLYVGAGRIEYDTALEGGFRIWDLPDAAGLPGSTWTLAELGDGRFIGGLAMRDFLTDHIVDAAGCLATNLRMVNTGHDFRMQSEAAVKELIKGDLTADDALEQAAALRSDKHSDPVLGVIAAYLYHSAGEIESIRRMAGFYRSHNQPVPYDIALLARVPTDRVGDMLIAHIPPVPARKPITPLERQYSHLFSASPAVDVPVAGSFPIMRSGWSLLGARDDVLVRSGLADLAAELSDSPFTTLSPAGGQQLIDLLKEPT